ncbi:MAG: sulfurtransferase [Gemmatimonadaceae bacterium]|nr:sulfurtransferase [Gemmatimonadaceae bacterium]
MDHSPGFLKIVEHASKNVREVSVADAQAKMKSGVPVFDVREDLEYSAGHAKGARHLGKGIIERDIEKTVPDKSAEMILYCGGGFRSALAADALQKMGYTNVWSMAGGWRAWNEAGAPVEQAATRAC